MLTLSLACEKSVQGLSCLPCAFYSVLACTKSLCMFQRLSCSIYLSLSFYVAISPYQQYTALSFSNGRHDRIHKLTVSRKILCYTADRSFSDA